MTDEYLTLEEVCACLKIGYSTVRKYIARPAEQRPLPARRLGRQFRVKRQDLDEWMRVEGQPAPTILHRKPLARARSLHEIGAEVQAAARR
jgi:excisionase family DNA binding protein